MEAKNREINADAVWHRSSETGGVEVAFLATGNIGLRDAKNPDGPVLIFTPGEWTAFVAGAKDGEFNRPGAEPHAPRAGPRVGQEACRASCQYDHEWVPTGFWSITAGIRFARSS